MARTGRPVLFLGAMAVVVAALGTSVALTRAAGPVAKAATTVTQTEHAMIVAPNGHQSAAHVGQRVPNGYVVRTARGGSAALTTRGRVVYVGASAAVAVVNGARQQLRTGTAVFDAQHGPGLDVDLAGDVVAVPDGSATEATRSVSVVVGSLAGPSSITNSSARHLTIPALYQAMIAGDALPSTTAPLHLGADRAAEAHAVPALVDADQRLQTLANGIDASGAATAGVIEASWSAPTASLPNGARASEHVLPIVIADATTSDGNAAQRYTDVVDWRSAGGSWGVTLGLLSGEVSKVESKLSALQHGQPAGQIGTPASVQAFGRPTIGGGGGGTPHPGHTNHPTHPTSPPPTKDPGGGTPTPKPTKGAVGQAVDTVDGVVSKVIGLLPKKLLPLPKPHPSSSPGLLGSLLGH